MMRSWALDKAEMFFGRMARKTAKTQPKAF